MDHSHTEIRRIVCSKTLHTVVFVIAMISFTLNGSNARAASVMPSDYRPASSKFDDTRHSEVAFKMRPRRRLRSKALELAIGAPSTSQDYRPFVSLGQMLRPLVIHERNAATGLTNRLLARLARVVPQAFPGSSPVNMKAEPVDLGRIISGMNAIVLNIAFDYSIQ